MAYLSTALTVEAPSSFVLTQASLWIEAALLGSIATAIAVLAIAWLGLLMLSGRLPVRRGAIVLLGCFILFGASTIAQGLIGLASSDLTSAPDVDPSLSPTAGVPPSTTNNANSSSDDNADPYFGGLPRH